MRHTSIKVANKCLITTLLLILGVVSTHAQYYMNIRQTDGTRLRYSVSAIDSVWFDNDEQQGHSANYEFVDLGLSVKWATFNVGATWPEEYGDYFAWGETETYYEAGYAQENPQDHWKDGKSDGYWWSNYKYCKGSYDALTKYCRNSKNGRYGYNGYTDTLTTLTYYDDVARVAWGGNWRMPTKAEFFELMEKCNWEWIAYNGVDGWRVTSKKDSSQFIFLPAAGCLGGNNAPYGVGTYGEYWSSSLSIDDSYAAWEFYFQPNSRSMKNGNRNAGLTVRPVCP